MFRYAVHTPASQQASLSLFCILIAFFANGSFEIISPGAVPN
jgi:hypothetical protein